MKKLILFLMAAVYVSQAFAQQPTPTPSPALPPNRPQNVAGIPVNYDEDKVGNYTLPDLFLTQQGKRITTRKDWIKMRRPEIVKLFEQNQFGRAPGRPAAMIFDVFDKGSVALNGKAIRKQVTVQFAKEWLDSKITLVIYLPKDAKKKVPLLLNLSFAAPNQMIDDRGIRVGEIWNREGKRVRADQPTPFGKMNVEQFIDAGFGFATVYYGDIEPDFKDGIKHGIRSKYLKAGQAEVAKDEWGAVAAWAWGLSRAMDYFETDKQIDAKRIAIQGASRLGKTVLWAGANDTRFKMVIASISGESGAAISRRNYGETVAHMTHPTRYGYQYAPKYHTYSDRVAEMPMDGHMLVALIAPRPLLLQTGSTDYWSDPRGEWLSAIEAARVYKLFGETAPSGEMPAANDSSMLLNKLGFYMHDGGHTVLPDDWKKFIEFMKKYL